MCMNNNPKVSILLPIYNVEDFIDDCISSCIAQTYSNIEIVVINDGSLDNSFDIVERYRATDSRIRHIRQSNKGIAMTRKIAMEICTGEYFMFVDGDDFIEEQCVERFVESALSSGADVVYSDYYRFIDGVKNYVCTNPKNISISNGVEYLESGISTFMWAKLYKRELVSDLMVQRTNVSEDYHFNLQILMRCPKVVYVKEPLYYYRYNEKSLICSKMDKIANAFLYHAIDRRELYPKINFTSKIYHILYYDDIRIILCYLKGVGYDVDIKKFIDIVKIKYFEIKSFKEFKMTIFLIMSKLCPRLAVKIIRLKDGYKLADSE